MFPIGVFLWAIRFVPQKDVRFAPLPIGIVACLLIALTFLDRGLEGVHRWLALGPIVLQPAAIVLPSIITAMYALSLNLSLTENTKNKENKSVGIGAIILSMTMATLLVLQPDAAQMTAFAVATSLLLVLRFGLKSFVPFLILILLGYTYFSWMRPDPIAPVMHVERIYELAYHRGLIYVLVAILATVLLFVPFITIIYRKQSTNPLLVIALGGYFLTCLVATFIGNFPVPIIGYGLSAILGYSTALIWIFYTSAWRSPSIP